MSTSDTPTPSDRPSETGPRSALPRRRALRAAAALLLAFGTGGALVHFAAGARHVTVLALTPGPIASVADGSAALRGQVADVFGDKFVLADDTGRALVETGPAARGAALVKPGEAVTVQGRFDHGSLHATVLLHADGRQDALDAGPAGPPPPPGPRGLHAGF